MEKRKDLLLILCLSVFNAATAFPITATTPTVSSNNDLKSTPEELTKSSSVYPDTSRQPTATPPTSPSDTDQTTPTTPLSDRDHTTPLPSDRDQTIPSPSDIDRTSPPSDTDRTTPLSSDTTPPSSDTDHTTAPSSDTDRTTPLPSDTDHTTPPPSDTDHTTQPPSEPYPGGPQPNQVIDQSLPKGDPPGPLPNGPLPSRPLPGGQFPNGPGGPRPGPLPNRPILPSRPLPSRYLPSEQRHGQHVKSYGNVINNLIHSKNTPQHPLFFGSGYLFQHPFLSLFSRPQFPFGGSFPFPYSYGNYRQFTATFPNSFTFPNSRFCFCQPGSSCMISCRYTSHHKYYSY